MAFRFGSNWNFAICSKKRQCKSNSGDGREQVRCVWLRSVVMAKDSNAPKQPWYKSVWKSVLALTLVCGTFWGIFEVVYVVATWHKDEVALSQNVTKLGNSIDSLLVLINNADQEIENIENYIDKKKQSYQVGFRVVRQYDDETHQYVSKKMFRAWDGILYEVHYDYALSQTWGYDYYFYVDIDGEKIYVIGNG